MTEPRRTKTENDNSAQSKDHNETIKP